MHEMFRHQNFFETRKSSPTKCFGTVRQKNRRRIVILLPLLCMKIFDTRSFRKDKKIPLQSFSVLRDKKFPTENRDTPFLCIKFFDAGFFPRHRSVRLRNVSVLWDKTIFDRKSWYSLPPPPSYPWNFSIREIFWNTEGFLYEMFRYCETQKFSRENRDTLLDKVQKSVEELCL